MRTRIGATIVVAGLILAACGGSSDSGDGEGGGSGIQADAAAATMDAARASGVELDESCVSDVADKLSNEDAQAIVDAGPDGDADISDAGNELANELIKCISQDDLIDQFILGMSADGEPFDEDCVRENLQDFDLTELAGLDADAPPPDDMVAALLECFAPGS